MSTSASNPNRARSRLQQYGWPAGGLIVLLSLAGAAWVTAGQWWPVVAARWQATTVALPVEPHDEHAHEDEDPNRIEISPQAQQNIGLELGQLTRRDFHRTLTLPAMLAEQPGRSHIVVTTHFTGIVTKIYVAQGQTVKAGQPLFDLRLTHEEVIQSQTDLLKTAQEIEILDREIARIEQLAKEGGIAGKTLIDRKVERERHQAAFVAQKQAMLLHEMTEEQISQVLRTKELIGSITLTALGDEGMVENPEQIVLQVHDLAVMLGQHIEAGTTLAVLSDHSQLLVEGEAFEQDLPALSRALAEDWPLELLPAAATAEPRVTSSPTTPPTGTTSVELLYLADKIDPAARTFHFYARLPNVVARDAIGHDGRRYVQWRYRPGERLRVAVPVERWPARLFVPLAAVAQDGVETYVFRYQGGAFVRTPVHVEYRDERFAVLANDDAIREGQVIAMSGGQQLQFALANKASGGVDPHAGHNH
jgi:cobalt-zinc-cadmium efflux system membrane fusion protein